MTRFLCTGDLHLGAGSDLGREPGDRLKDQATTLGCIVELARDHQVDAILFAGDAFEGPTVTPEQYAAFQRPLRDLEVPFIAITGNGRHDCAMRDVKAPEVVADVAEIYTNPSVRVVGDTAVCMLPWTSTARIVAAQDGGDRDDIHQYAAELLINVARALKDGVDADRKVLMLHYSIEGAALPNGLPIEAHAREPIIALAALEELGFDAVIAAHIHVPQMLSLAAGGGQPIFYTGSPMPLNFGEGHYEHGVYLLDLDIEPPLNVTFVPIYSRPLVTVDLLPGEHDIDATPFDDAIVRVRYTATEEQARRIDHAEITQAFYDAGAHKVHSIQAEILRDERVRVDGLDEEVGPREAAAMWANTQELDDELRGSFADLTDRYLEEAAR